MRNERITYEEQYQGHPIMTDKEKQLGCKEAILQKIDQLMTDMSNRHSKVFFMRYDVRFPKGYGHYHVALMLDGHKTQNIHDHIQTAERLWEKTLNLPPKNDDAGRTTSYGLIDDCMRNRQGQPQENGVMLRKDDPEYERKYDQCFRRCSYLAKVNQKDSAPKHRREVFSSRIQH